MSIMRYNYKKIGKRLKEERKKAGFKSHDSLSDYIGEHNYRQFKRQTIAKWENGEELPPLDVLCTLCVPFNCELGYLLCEYDCKTRDNTDIQAALGLSETAINNLRFLSKDEIDIIDKLLCSEEFEYNILSKILIYKNSLMHSIEILNKIDVEMKDFHPPYTENDRERYNLVCALEKSLLKEIDTSQPLALWEIQKYFIDMIESIYNAENCEIKTRYKHA